MLLQTFVQLHILLAATPALAGWTLPAPTTHTLPAHITYFAGQNTIHAETLVVSAPQRQTAARATRNAAFRQVPAGPVAFAVSRGLTGQAVAADTLPIRDYIFSYSPRAP